MAETINDLHARGIGDIAAQLPGASAVFHRFGIEFCCQGHVSLADAASRRNVDLAEVQEALNALGPRTAPQVPTSELIDHIQTRYHDAHRRQIAGLIELSHKVESAHVNHPKVPAGLAQTMKQFRAELEALMKKQETIHFPVLQSKTPEQLALSIRAMRHDHDQFALFLDQIDRLTDGCTLPEDACATWQALYDDVVRFRTDLIEHIHLENNVLFPRFEIMAQG